MGFIVERKKLAKLSKIVQRTLCCYDMFPNKIGEDHEPDFCDCKYGAREIYGSNYHGEQTGCPEMRCINKLLNLMTDAEYLEIMERDQHNILT